MQLISSRTPASVDAQFRTGAEALEWIVGRCAERHAEAPQPLDWIYQSRAYHAHDVGTTDGFNGDIDQSTEPCGPSRPAA